MTFLPVVSREMRVAARRPVTYWFRSGSALAALVATAWVLALASPLTGATVLGLKIFSILSYGGFCYALLAGLMATSDCISAEKREGTLGLMFLTDLRSYDVVLGKISAGALNAAYALGGIVPMIALGLLLGGVTLGQVGKMALVLGNTLFLTLGLGVFISTLSTNERRAMFAASVLLFLLIVGPFVIAFSLASRTAVESILWFSPAYPMLAVQSWPLGLAGFTGESWRSSLLFLHGLGWLLLISSCISLPHLVNGVTLSALAGAGQWFHRVVYGGREARRRHRTRLLDRNAFLWLVSRERVKARYAWVLVAFFAGMYGWLISAHPNLAGDMPINAAIILTVHATLKVWLASEACNRLVEDKRAGALELLLTTPLGVREIARGQSLALRRIFLGPILVLAAAELWLAWGQFDSSWRKPSPEDRAFSLAAVAVMLVLDAWALKWIGLWRSLWSKGVERALLSTVSKGLALPCLVFATVYSGANMLGSMLGRPPSYRTILVAWFGINVAFALWFGLRSRWCFLRHFRECAAGRFEGAEPKLEALEEARASEPGGRLPWWRRRPIAVATCALLFLLAAGVAGRRAVWQMRVNAEIARIRAEKLPTTMVELQSSLRKPTPTQDAGRVLMEAGFPAEIGRGFDTWQAMLQSGGKRPAWNFSAQGGINETLEANRRQLSALWSITNKPGFELPFGMEPRSLARYGVLGCVDYFDALDKGDRERAVRDVRGLIALARALRGLPQFYAQQQACEVLRDLTISLQTRPSFTEADWEGIAAALAWIDDGEVLQPLLQSHRVHLLGAGPRHFLWRGPSAQANATVKWANEAIRAVGSEHKRLHGLLQDYRSALEFAKKPNPERLDALQAWRLPLFMPQNSPIMSTVDPLRSAIAHTVWRDAEFTARAEVLRAAVAFIRHHKARGFLPDSFDELVPKYLPEVPKDPFSGQPLVLRKGKTWLIYSVGWNRSDDGGAHAIYSEGSDFVFRYEL